MIAASQEGCGPAVRIGFIERAEDLPVESFLRTLTRRAALAMPVAEAGAGASGTDTDVPHDHPR
ncbi:hypothetical protein QBC98_003439 [Kitasatospora acidiphila]